MWSLDGVNVTDMSATGATTMYYNFDSFEQMQYNIGGNDVTIATGGMGVNLVTKSGSDKLRGSGRYLITDNKLQDDNVTDALRAQGASAGNPIQRNQDYGIEGGGPIMKGRLWFWGAVARTDVKVGVNNFFTRRCGLPDDRRAGAHWSIRRRCAAVCRPTRRCSRTTRSSSPAAPSTATASSGSATTPTSSATRATPRRPVRRKRSYIQTGPVWTHKVNDQHVFTDRWLGEVQYAFVGGGFALDFPDPEAQFGVQRYFDEVTEEYRRSLPAEPVRSSALPDRRASRPTSCPACWAATTPSSSATRSVTRR